MPSRKKLTDSTHFEVVYRSARRCCMCFTLSNDFTQKPGQIAHIDQDRTNNSPTNLAWLCLPHHDEYDTRTSQSKGYSEPELRHYRELLHSAVESWRVSQPHSEPIDLFRYKQTLLEENTGVFFFAAFAGQTPETRKRLLAEVQDPDFRAQILEALQFLDDYALTQEVPLSREDQMARYIGGTGEGRQDLRILLGLAGQAISWMNEKDRNDALFALHSDTIRSGLMLLHKIRVDKNSGGSGGA